MDGSRIYQNVKLGNNVEIGPFCVIGVPPRGAEDGEYETIIGDNAVIRSHTVIYAGNAIGHNFQTGHGVSIREHNNIGDNVSIGTHSIIEHHLAIEDGVRIHSNVFVPEYTLLKKKCWIGPNAVFTNAIHPLCPEIKKCLKGPVVEEGAIIGANATLMPHIVIGKNSLIGAGSIVTKDVQAGYVYSGSPAVKKIHVSGLKCRFDYIDKPYGEI